MDDENYISLYHEISENAVENVFKRFKNNSKLILTESDLKCWLFLHLQQEIDSRKDNNLYVHTEVTHYLDTDNRANKRFRDITLLDSTNLSLNESIWYNNEDGLHTLNKGFNHNGPAMHFELKLIRQGFGESSSGKIDTSDIANLNNVDCINRAYTIVWISKNKNLTIENLEENLIECLKHFKRECLVKQDLFRIYLIDTNQYKIYKKDDIILLQ